MDGISQDREVSLLKPNGSDYHTLGCPKSTPGAAWSISIVTKPDVTFSPNQGKCFTCKISRYIF